MGPRKLPLAGRNRRPPNALCAGRGIGLAPLSLKAGGCIFSQGGQQEKCIFPPAAFQRKVNVAGIFYGRGGSNWRGFLGWFHTTSPWAVFIPRALAYYSQGGPGRSDCVQWEASVDCNNYGLTGPLPDHAWRPVSFVCVFLYRPSNLYRKFIM